MSGEDGTYAPRSPDLSSFFSGPTTTTSEQVLASATAPQSALTGAQPQQLTSQQSRSQFSTPQQRLHLQPPTNTYFSGAPTLSHKQQYQQQQQQYQQQQQQQQQSPLYSPYFTSPQAGPGYTPVDPVQSPSQGQGQKGAPFHQSYGAPYWPQYPVQPSHFYGSTPTTTPATSAAPPLPGYGTGAAAAAEPDLLSAQSATGPGTMPPRRTAASASSSASVPAIEPSPVKTKFPTARIKRIMQADEEVGKVAQQTPIAVGKALEMFMVQLVTKSADVAREKNSRRVSAQMLKQVVEADDQWDFLRDIVSRVENEEKEKPSVPGAAGKGRAKVESSSEEEEVVEKKKRVGRKKRGAA